MTLNPEHHEIRQEKHYYPFGLHMEHPDFWVDYPEGDRHQYNSIENVNLSNALLYAAHYRTLDPGLGRWLQVDPAAEHFYGLTPYNSMANNPMAITDPDGDFILAPVLIGAAIGVLSNGIQNLANNQKFFNNWGQAAVIGAVSGVVTMGIGNIGTGIAQATGSKFLGSISTAALHGHFGGSISSSFGGNYIDGFAGGLFGSSFASLSQGLNFGSPVPSLLFGGVGGGVGSMVGGGSFKAGFGHGLLLTAFNHLGHDPICCFTLDEIIVNGNYSNQAFQLGPTVEAAGYLGVGITAAGYAKAGNNYWLGDNFKYYNKNWGGNQHAGSRNFNMWSSRAFKISGAGLSATNYLNIYHNRNNYNNVSLAGEFTSTTISTFGGLPGLAWGLGWESGRVITRQRFYQNWKYNTWLPYRRRTFGY